MSNVPSYPDLPYSSSVSRLAYGNFEEYPANSCLDIRDHRLSTPPSKAYYINTTDSCTEESNITKVRRQEYIKGGVLKNWMVEQL